jgi:hypothetical protein
MAATLEESASCILPPAVTTRPLDRSVVLTTDDKDPIQFDNDLVFALSCIRHIREHSPRVTLELTDDQEQHLELLDGIALLLVTDDKADAAAVTFEQTPESIEFYYAKNRPCTDAEKSYIDSLLNLVMHSESSQRNACTMAIVSKAVAMCLKKVRSRIRKLASEITRCGVMSALEESADLGNLAVRTRGVNEGVLGRVIANAYDVPVIEKMPSNEESLLHYFRIVLELNTSITVLRNKIADLTELMMLSYVIGMIDHPFSNYHTRTGRHTYQCTRFCA